MNKDTRTIVHISPFYYPHLGGLERVAKTSAENLAKDGYQVRVVTSTSSGLKRGTVKDGNLTTTVLWSVEFAQTPIMPMFLWYLLTLPRNSLIHLHLAQAYAPELVLLVSKIRRIPYIVHFHLDVGPSSFWGPLFMIYKKLVWWPVLKNAKMVIAQSEEQEELINTKFGIPKDKIVDIPNSVRNIFFTNKTHEAPKDKLRLLYAGRIAVQKRVERLIEIVTKLSIPAHLSIVGSGDETPKLEKMISDLKLTNVSLEGRKNDEEMKQYHKNSDIFLLSSDSEGGTPLVVLEAMAGGLPVVATNVTGTRDHFKGYISLIDEPYIENFVKTIERLWHNPAEFAELSKKSLEKADQHTELNYIRQIEELYDKVK